MNEKSLRIARGFFLVRPVSGGNPVLKNRVSAPCHHPPGQKEPGLKGIRIRWGRIAEPSARVSGTPAGLV